MASNLAMSMRISDKVLEPEEASSDGCASDSTADRTDCQRDQWSSDGWAWQQGEDPEKREEDLVSMWRTMQPGLTDDAAGELQEAGLCLS